MDEHQRRMWARMLEQADAYRSGSLSLESLVDHLRGLYVEADPHNQAIRDGFEYNWSALDSEHELRTESWAPPGLVSEDQLNLALMRFTTWVEALLAADESHDHG